jgi:flavin reductase (DIM6/NTAB) family NADH-FMN oxidoreductase RutF
MKRSLISLEDLDFRAFDFWSEYGIVLAAGDFASKRFNAMAIGWGGFGNMWGRPFAHVVVRPVRYTHEFMEAYDSFTVCAFGEEHQDAVKILGGRSGRHGDKIAEAGLTPIASTKINAPGFDEAQLILECREIYRSRLDPAGFLDKDIDKHYPQKDYHSVYYGEVLAAFGVKAFLRG